MDRLRPRSAGARLLHESRARRRRHWSDRGVRLTNRPFAAGRGVGGLAAPLDRDPSVLDEIVELARRESRGTKSPVRDVEAASP